tara:strand:+ start:1030 stop:1284 length:255 start_codon:yes stop_codon:yes gene_type:complete
MRVGDVKKWLPEDEDEEIIIAWWVYGDGEAYPEWLTKEVWYKHIVDIDGGHDWSYDHDAIVDHFNMLVRFAIKADNEKKKEEKE